jgi:RND family efflux transporter MFP subunit
MIPFNALLRSVLGALLVSSLPVGAALPVAPATGDRSAQVTLREVDETYAADAVIESVNQATVSAQISGNVTQFLVDAGDRVKKGQLLARIDPRDTDSQVAVRRAGVAQAEAMMLQARQNFERTRSLLDKNFISQAALDKADADYRAARAEVEAARAANVQASTARSHAELRSPIDGVVTRRLMEVGELAAPGRAVIALHDPASLRAVGSIPQFMLAKTAKYSGARVVLPSTQQVIEATKVTVLPAADPRLLSTQVRADLPAAAIPGLAPGVAAKILLTVGKTKKLVVPESALIRRGELTAVNVLVAEGRPQLRQVRVGLPAGNGLVEVLAGLTEGERVAIDPLAAR